MNRPLQALAGLFFLAFVLALAAPGMAADTILRFETMAGVTDPFLGSTNPLRGVPGGGLPWQLEAAKGSLETDGSLRVEVFGLVLADDPRVPADRRLLNPASDFRAIVSCLTGDELEPDRVFTLNLTTDLFPASVSGDATIEAVLDLPDRCFAPIVFVTSPTGSWFAVTGF